MEAAKLKSEPTLELAKFWARTGTEILFESADPFDGQVSKEKLEANLLNQILENILKHETTDISEEQFQKCIDLSKIN